jgi:hypothetical protein
LNEEVGDVEASVPRRVRRKSPGRFLELAFAADAPSAAGLVPGDRDVDQPLEKIALSRLGGPPGLLELLVCVKVPAGSDQLESALVAHKPRLLESPRAEC